MAARVGERARRLREDAGRITGHALNGVTSTALPAFDLLDDV